MTAELQSIERISDVSYLLIRLRLAQRKNEAEIKEVIIKRLKDLGLLKDEKGIEGTDFVNLRNYINKILVT